MAKRAGLFGPGQRESISRGERTDPLTVVWQALWAILVLALACLIVRGYIAAWDWITERELHSWLAPPAAIATLVCLITGIILIIEVMDPNWPNPRESTSSTQPLTPLSKERAQRDQAPRINLKFRDILDALNLELDESDDDDE